MSSNTRSHRGRRFRFSAKTEGQWGSLRNTLGPHSALQLPRKATSAQSLSSLALHRNRVAVIIPAFEEEQLIEKTLSTIPPWVDEIIVVNDGSQDGTRQAVLRREDPRVLLIDKTQNQGVGQAILDGYALALERDADVLVVMAGDNQMDPADLPGIVSPVLENLADYVKGNRFRHAEHRRMPLQRRIAGRCLARLTSWAANVSIDDSQCGYTAISSAAAKVLLASDIWPRYGYPNDVLVVLGRCRQRIMQVPVRPVYEDEKSGVRWWHVVSIVGIIFQRRFRPTPSPLRGGLPRSLTLTNEGEGSNLRIPFDATNSSESPTIDSVGPR